MDTPRAAPVRRGTTVRRLLAPLLALLTLTVGGCQLISRKPPAPPAHASSASSPVPSTDTSPNPAEVVQHMLAKIDGISDTYPFSHPIDFDCEPGNDKVEKLDVRFTAADATAMRAALLAGRTYQREYGDDGYLCLIGSYPDDKRTVQVDLTNDFAGADDTWPSVSMITALVQSSRRELHTGKTPLRWAATADTDSALTLSYGLDDDALGDAQAISVFTRLQRYWKPLSGYDGVTIMVATKSDGLLAITQQDGPAMPWKANLPPGMLKIFRAQLSDLGDVQMSRTVTDGEVDDRFDFLYGGSDSSMSWPRRQQVAHRVIDAYWALPADQHGHTFSIRSGHHTELDFDTTTCNGILPGMNHRQDAPQTRALYRWYAEHYPKQAEKGGVAHCLGQHI